MAVSPEDCGYEPPSDSSCLLLIFSLGVGFSSVALKTQLDAGRNVIPGGAF